MSLLNVAKSKSLRGDIIRSLYDLYDTAIPISRVHDLLRYKSFYNKEDIRRAVGYLSGDKKEYVQIELNDKDYGASFVKLTPAGINLAEGDITDMGVQFGE
ncbi:MAG: hypothetical protein FWD98_03810 [Defluviitaleaceae bacterium]|nr:hypothetical protein [Defluviitaleaceae bacterium]